ncbi:MAG: chorismate synthase [Acidobacteriota bacterium]
MSLRTLRLLTAGESHGPMLVAILEGLPAGLSIDLGAVNDNLARRMAGHGRGKRMKIERDQVRVVGGMRHGHTLGSPIGLLIDNRDWPNWQQVMDAELSPSAASGEENATGSTAESGNRPGARVDRRRVTRPRPGHADLAGGLKYNRSDLRDVLERASARETAARVAAGAFCKQFLRQLQIEIASHVIQIGAARLPADKPIALEAIRESADASPVRCADAATEAAMIAAIDTARDDLDTLGGAFEVLASNLPAGLGSHVQWDRKLDGRIAQAMMSIPAQKAVEIGDAIWASSQPGSRVHDPIHYDRSAHRFFRPSNHAGGTEGGISYGGELRVRVYMKPLSTLRKPLPSVDILTGEAAEAVVQRSDVCAVPAAAVVGEAMLALVIADACLEKFGGDSIEETQRNLQGFLEQVRRFPPAAE